MNTDMSTLPLREAKNKAEATKRGLGLMSLSQGGPGNDVKFHYQLLQDIEHGSLCVRVGPCC